MPQSARKSTLLPVLVLALGVWCWGGSRSFTGIYPQARAPHVARAQESPAVEQYSKGDTVEAVFPEDGEWYSGIVENVNDDGNIEVRWDDADGGPETSPCKPEDVKKVVPRVALTDLVVGSKTKGIVRNSAPFGIFVDINADRDGLVHISKIPEPSGELKVDATVEAVSPDDGEWYRGTISKDNSDGTLEVTWDDADGGPESHSIKKENIKLAAKQFEVGEEVDVWIEQVRDDRLSLSMLAPPDLSEFAALSPSDFQDATVVSVAKFGAFVNVKSPSGGSPQRGLVHISQLQDGFVEDPSDVVKIGDQVKVRILEVNEERQQMRLSMLP